MTRRRSAGEVVRCAPPFRLIVDRSQLHVSGRSEKPPGMCVCVCVWIRGAVVCTCAQAGGGLRSGRMWNRMRAISDRWWDCASDPVYVGVLYREGRRKKREAGEALMFSVDHVLNTCSSWQWKYRGFLKTSLSIEDQAWPDLTPYITKQAPSTLHSSNAPLLLS